jgi:type II secretory pathway pseudopilin PulG
MSSFRHHGFAYIWTLMLVALMGVGTAIGSELYATSVRRDKERELLFIGHEFRAAISRYYSANAAGQSAYPVALEDLLKDPRFPNARRHLRKLYRDPVSGKAEWGAVLVQGRIVGVHSLSELAPVKVGNFDVEDAGFKGKQKYSEWVFTYPHDMFVAKEGLGGSGQPPEKK